MSGGDPSQFKLATHIVSTYDLVSQYASSSKDPNNAHHPHQSIPTLHELNRLHQELHALRDDLSNRRSRLRADDERVKSLRARVKGKDKERPQPLSQSLSNQSKFDASSTKGPPHHSPPTSSSAASGPSKPLKVQRDSSARSSSADLSDSEIPVKRKKDSNRKRKRRPGIPVDSDDEYSDAPTPPSTSEFSKQDHHHSKARKTMPPSTPAPLGSASMPPPLPRANSLSDIPSALSNSALSNGVRPSSARQASPSLASSLPPSSSLPGLKLKLNSFKKEGSETSSQTAASPPKKHLALLGVAEDFSLPHRTLVPPEPVLEPPQPLPQRQEDVMGDFSKSKAGQQVPYNTFTSFIDAYVRALGDDDIAYLSQKSDDYGPFVIPGLGRYYLDAWMDDDYKIDPSTSALQPPRLQRFRPEDVSEDKLATESIYAGPLSERLTSSISATALSELSSLEGLFPESIPKESSVKVNGDATSQPHPQDSTTGPEASAPTNSQTDVEMDASLPTSAKKESPDTLDLEERVRRELRFLGAFPSDTSSSLAIRSREGDVDWANRRDDEISASLRECQRRLNHQITINECRKARLAQRVHDRMARQDFEALRETLEKQIEAGWQKRQRIVKKKPGLRGAAAAAAAAAAAQAGKPLAEDLTSGKRVPLPDHLVASMDKRQRLVNGFKPMFEAEPERFKGIPMHSIHGDDPAQGAVPKLEEEDGNDGSWKENGLHSQPDTAAIPAVIVQ